MSDSRVMMRENRALATEKKEEETMPENFIRLAES